MVSPLRISAGLIFLFSSTIAAGETPETPSWPDLVDSTLEVMNDGMSTMRGKIENDDQVWRIVAKHFAKNPYAMSKLDSLTRIALESDEPNQQEVFLKVVFDFFCREAAENCALRNEVAAMRLELDAVKRKQEELHEPTLADGFKNEIMPAPSPPILTQPLQSVPAPEINPSHAPYLGPVKGIQPRWRWTWNGQIDRIAIDPRTVDQSDLVALCVDVMFPDGDIYHCNVFCEYGGRFTILRHPKTSPERSPRIAAR